MFATRLSRLVRLAVLASVIGGLGALIDAPTAHAAVSTAMDRCTSGQAADVTETVFHPNSQVQVTFPTGSPNPDNGIYPGDVVRVIFTPAAGTTGSSTATFNNNPGGWVGSEMPTSQLAACTAAPASFPVRIIYRHQNVTSTTGGFTITTKVWRAPGRLSIDRTELTQGIQTPQNEVALIGGKRTFLRVFLRHKDDGLGPMSGVTASLSVDGVTGTFGPLVTSSITTSTTGSDPRSLTDSFLFELPASGINMGSRQATITVRPPANRGGGWAVVKHIPLSFGPTTSLNVIGIRYSYYNVPQALTDQLKATQPGLNVAAGWWQARQIADWEPLRRTAENLLPLTRLTITDDAPANEANSQWGTTWFDCKAQQDGDGNWSCGGYADAKEWETNYVDQLCPNGGCTAMMLQPEIDNGEHGTDWFSPKGNNINNMQGERQADRQGNTLAHELGHSLTLAHTWEDASYPRADGGLGPFIAVRYSPSIALVSGRDAAGNTTAWDLMSYQRPAWFSPRNYCKAMAHLSGSHPLCALGLVG